MDNTTFITVLLFLIIFLVVYTDRILKVKKNESFNIPHEIFESVINHVEHSVVIIFNKKILYVNKIFEETTGLRYEEIRGFGISALSPINYPVNITEPYVDYKIFYSNTRGMEIQESLSMIHRKWNDKDYHIIVGYDLSKLAHREKHFMELANHDPLTNLLNKSYICEQMSNMIKNKDDNERALLFLDLDNFKSINDKLGHIFGDKIIIEMSKRVNSLLVEDDLIARIYGDEFAVLLKRNTIIEIDQVTKDIIETVSENYNIDGISIKCSCSIGLLHFKAVNESSPESMLEKADTAMYKAKSLGKNTFSIYTE